MAGKTCLIVALLLAAGSAVAEVGDLTPAAVNEDMGIFPPVPVSGSLAGKAPADSGLSEKAIIGELQVPGQKLSIQVAMDITKPDGKEPDVVYLDFSGKGKFDKSAALPLHPIEAPKSIAWAAGFGPSSLSFEQSGKKASVTVQGMTVKMEGQQQDRMVGLTFQAVVAGQCDFGGKSHAVRFVDNTADFAFDEKGNFDRKDPRGMGMSVGDVVMVDTGDGSFAKSVVKAYYGQPVFVDGAWYDVTVSPDGAKASAKPIEVKVGKLAVDAEKWEAIVEDGGKAFLLNGGKEPLPVPAGQYRLVCYRQWSAPDDKGQRGWLIAVDRQAMSGDGKGPGLTIKADTVTPMAAATPMKAKLEAAVDKTRSVKLSMSSPDTPGKLSVVMLTRPGGWINDQPPPPKVKITDAAGTVVATVDLEYG